MSIADRDVRMLGSLTRVLLDLAGRSRPTDAVPTRESLERLEQLFAAYRAAVRTILREGTADCPGSSVDVQVYDGPFKDIVRRGSASVVQVLYDNGSGVLVPSGTASLVKGPNLLLTAAHVVPPEWAFDGEGMLVVRFGYERDRNGSVGSAVDFPVDNGFEYYRSGVDYVLLDAGPDANGRLPGDLCAEIPLGTVAGATAGDPLICIHHPKGDPKAVSVGTLHGLTDSFIQYDNHTAARSSGAPVLDRHGNLIALHQGMNPAGGCLREGAHGDLLRRVSHEL